MVHSLTLVNLNVLYRNGNLNVLYRNGNLNTELNLMDIIILMGKQSPQ